MKKSINVEIKKTKMFGLECFNVFVNGVYFSQFLSLELARTKVKAIISELEKLV